MSDVTVNGADGGLNTKLQDVLMSDDIQPGSDASYEMCKTIYVYHPLGAKLVDSPIELAQSQTREISVPNSPEERVKEAFAVEWLAIAADNLIANTKRLSRVYGISTIAMITDGVPSNEPVDYKSLWKANVSFNCLDPLNTAGSLVLPQDANSPSYQKQAGDVVVSGTGYHPSRTVVVSNGDPLFISYTVSAFGFVGRSVYQRGLFPLKSFIRTMITDDMVSKKAGVMVAKLKSPGSVINQLMSGIAAIKRTLLKEAEIGNVISISSTDNESIETLDLANVDKAMESARRHILENLAASDNMPAKLLNSETFAEGFGEGTEDAKNVARYIDRFRISMQPLYAYMDKIVQHRAWNPDFYKSIQEEFPDEYGSMDYNTAFYQWVNCFAAKWPSLLTEPDSEKVKVDDVKLKAAIAIVESLLPQMDPENKAALVGWLQDNLNSMKFLFDNPLVLDLQALAEFTPPVPGAGDSEEEPENEGKGFAKADADDRPALRAYNEAVVSLQQAAEDRRRTRPKMITGSGTTRDMIGQRR